MYRTTVVLLFVLVAGAVAVGLGDFAWLSRQASVVMLWVVPPLTAGTAIFGLFRHRQMG